MKQDDIYLRSILDAINQINDYTKGGYEEFINNQMIQDAVVLRLLNIGEAVKHLDTELTTSRPDIPWKRIAGMRNFMIHEYLEVDYEIVWGVIQHDLPDLNQAIAEVLTKL